MVLIQATAISVAKHLWSLNLLTPIFVYGSASRLLIGYGKDKELRIRQGQPHVHSKDGNLSANPCDIWASVHHFLSENSEAFIFSYLSFDLHYPESTNPYPLLKFVIPTLTIEVTSTGIQKVGGTDTEGIMESLYKISSVSQRQNTDDSWLVDVTKWDATPIEQFIKHFEIVKSMINNREISRLTIARKIPLPVTVPLIDSFLARKTLGIESERAYLWRDEGLQFVGCNPELLASGNCLSFETFKLSGTNPRYAELKRDNYERVVFLNDKKIYYEHENSVQSVAESLKSLGKVCQNPRLVLDWYNLRHLMTKFTTVPLKNTTITTVLKTVLPTGCNPYAKGLETVRLLEAESRGPYYGLVGVIEPNGNFAFSQNIRTVFRFGTETHLWVGAAITDGSDALSEYQETQLKARNTAFVISPYLIKEHK